MGLHEQAKSKQQLHLIAKFEKSTQLMSKTDSISSQAIVLKNSKSKLKKYTWVMYEN